MNELEWYLDVGGKQSGPHTAKEIVELVRAGRIAPTSQVTAARMSGDWVSAQDLVDAYNELFAKSTVPMPMPIDEAAPFTSSSPTPPDSSSAPSSTNSQLAPMPVSGDSNFQAPPRPTEELERSKIIVLNRDEPAVPDPTDALFQAIQAVREKATQKVTTAAATAAARDNWGQSRKPRRLPPQLLLIGTLALIFGVTVYGISMLIEKKAEKAEVAKKTPSVAAPTDTRPAAIAPGPGGARLMDDGGGSGSANARRPVTPIQRSYPPVRSLPADDHNEGGGARYRDDRDAPIDSSPMERGEAPDPEEGVEAGPGQMAPGSVPIDPAQVAPDRIIPEAGGPAKETESAEGLPPQ